MSRRRPKWLLVVVLSCLLAVACGGGGDPSDDGAGAPVGPAQAAAGERPMQVEGAGKVRLFGMLALPAMPSGGSVPGVLVVPTGNTAGLLGATGVADPMAQDLATSFAEAGVASYRYDQRGSGESRTDPDVRLTFDDLVADARAGLDLLAQRRETAGRDLTVVGYDQGGLVALRLAATDNRVKRVVLMSTPGRSLLDVRAAQLQARYGIQSAEALRAEVANLLATRALPAIDQLRTELRPLLPAEDAAFLADVYGLDPVADASRVNVPAMIVVPSDAAPYGPQRLAAAIPGAQVVTSVGAGSTLSIEGPRPSTNADTAQHLHDGPPPSAPVSRDAGALDGVIRFVTAGQGGR